MLYFGLAVTVFVVGLGTIGGLIFYKRINRLQKIEAEATESYERVDHAYPFDPQSVAANGRTLRVAEYLKARDALLRELTPEVRADLEGALDGGGTTPARLLWRLQGSIDFIERASRNHVSALESSKMGISEYLWLHGLAMRDATRAKGERWNQCTTVLASLRTVGSGFKQGGPVGLDTAQIEKGLTERYAGIESSETLLDPTVKESKATAIVDVLMLVGGLQRAGAAPVVAAE